LENSDKKYLKGIYNFDIKLWYLLRPNIFVNRRRRKDNPNEIKKIFYNFSNYLESKRKSFFHPHPNFSFARKNDFGVRLPD